MAPYVSQFACPDRRLDGDALIQGFGFFLVTARAKSALIKLAVTGIQFSEVKVSESDVFQQLSRKIKLPCFLRAKIHGKEKVDDFANDESGLNYI